MSSLISISKSLQSLNGANIAEISNSMVSSKNQGKLSRESLYKKTQKEFITYFLNMEH
jgi:hypothetical protein